jgi:hypothetical protein
MPSAANFRLQAKTCLYLAGYAVEPWVVISLMELVDELCRRADRASHNNVRSARAPRSASRSSPAKRVRGR